jgi:polyhydroxybutyrate depolymerase
MRERRWAGLTLGVALSLSSTFAGAQGLPGHKLAREVTVDGVRREFLVHVPAGVAGRAPVPMVLMLHGTSGDGERFYGISGWVEKADAEGFIAVFPSALRYCFGDDDDLDGTIADDEYTITSKWAAGALGTSEMPLCTEEREAQFPASRRAQIQSRTVRDDVAFIDALVAAVATELPVDPRRMYVTGFSNGAQMSGRLMVERTTTFAAFAMAAGGVAVPGPALRPAPVVFSVGSLDDRFLERTGLGELPLDGTIVEVPGFVGFGARLTGLLGLDPVQQGYVSRPINGRTIATNTYDRSLVGADNQLIVAVIEGAHHVYPNGSNHPVVMADLLWVFFQRYTLP